MGRIVQLRTFKKILVSCRRVNDVPRIRHIGPGFTPKRYNRIRKAWVVAQDRMFVILTGVKMASDRITSFKDSTDLITFRRSKVSTARCDCFEGAC